MCKSWFVIENIFKHLMATSSRIKITTYLERLIALNIWQMLTVALI